MSRIGRALRSLRWRLTLTYLVLIAVLLAGLGVFQYASLRGSLIDGRVAELRGDLVAAQKLYASGDLTSSTTAAKVRTLGTLIRSASGQSVTVALFAPRGARLDAIPAGSDPPQLDPGTFGALVAQGTERHQIVGSDLVAGFTVGVTDLTLRRATAVVEVSEPMTPIDSVLSGDIDELAIGGGALLLLVLILGLLLTSTALRPLRRLTDTAGQLAGGDLRARSRLVPRGDEVGQLAGAFDHMADRIEEAFAAQVESESRVRRFIADASHELRTPVTALGGYIDVLRRGAAQSPQAMDAALGMMARESDRLRGLVLDLLTLARVDARSQQKPEDFDLVAALGRLLDEAVPGMPPQVVRDLSGHRGPQPPHQRQQIRTGRAPGVVGACGRGPRPGRRARRRARHPGGRPRARLRALLPGGRSEEPSRRLGLRADEPRYRVPGGEDAVPRGGRERAGALHRAGTGSRAGR